MRKDFPDAALTDTLWTILFKTKMQLDELYQEVILDHYKNPRCRNDIASPDCRCALKNILCGDTIDFMMKVHEGKILEVAFSGHGCSISQAGASMMADLCKGKSVAELRQLAKTYRGMMRGETSAEEVKVLGDAVSLEGVRKYTARIKCALLAWEALEKCLDQVESLSLAESKS